MTSPDWYQRKNDAQVAELQETMQQHIHQELQRDTAMAEQFAQLQLEVKKLNTQMALMLEILAQTKGALRFMKILAGFIATGAAGWAWIVSNLHIGGIK
jgi:hypothetical protein